MLRSMVHSVRVSRGPLAALGATGIVWGSFAAMVPTIKAQAQVSDAVLGTALLGSAAGGIVAMYLAPKFGTVVGRYVLPVFVIFAIAAMQLPALATTPIRLVSVLVAMGLAVASLDISANLRVSFLEERHGLHLMNLNHAMFSFCFGYGCVGGGRIAPVRL